MITERDGDLLEEPDLTHILHQCNLYCNFGKGLAAAIKTKYPEAYEADLQTGKGDKTKLGNYGIAKTGDGKWVINLYSQTGLHATDRMTSYDAMVEGLTDVRNYLTSTMTFDAALLGRTTKLGLPYRLGSGLANGSWLVVRAIIEDVFADAPFDVVIVRKAD